MAENSAYEASIGVGSGRGEKFVHGSLEAVQAVQRLCLDKQDLAELAAGCSTHPAYRAERPPTVSCKQCDRLWILNENLRARSAM